MKDNLGYEEVEKALCTNPIPFSQLPRQNINNSKIKFALKASKIGDFVPLRLWRYTGV